jgi:hypothetical protein
MRTKKHYQCRCGGRISKLPGFELWECDSCARVDTVNELRRRRVGKRAMTFTEIACVALCGPYPRVTWSRRM